MDLPGISPLEIERLRSEITTRRFNQMNSEEQGIGNFSTDTQTVV